MYSVEKCFYTMQKKVVQFHQFEKVLAAFEFSFFICGNQFFCPKQNNICLFILYVKRLLRFFQLLK